MSSVSVASCAPRVGDVISMRVPVYRWWERLLWRLTFRRYRMRGKLALRYFTITAESSSTVTIEPRRPWWWWAR